MHIWMKAKLKLCITNQLLTFSAPANVALQGNLSVTEGTFSNLFCSYNDSYPVGSSSVYYIGDVGTEISKVIKII